MEKKHVYISLENFRKTLAEVFSEECPSKTTKPKIYRKTYQINTSGNFSCWGYKRQKGTRINILMKLRYCDHIYTDVVHICIVNLKGFVTLEVQNCFKGETANHNLIYVVSNEHHTASSSGVRFSILPAITFGTGGLNHSTIHYVFFQPTVTATVWRKSMRGGADRKETKILTPDLHLCSGGKFL